MKIRTVQLQRNQKEKARTLRTQKLPELGQQKT
jgi:hypothetical protein